MPYKRFSPTAHTFPVTNFELIFRKPEFFNSHRPYRTLTGTGPLSRITYGMGIPGGNPPKVQKTAAPPPRSCLRSTVDTALRISRH